MNGYEMMADSYRQLMKQGRIEKETADKEIRIYDFLATCDTEDICRMVDSSAFNDIIKAFVETAVKNADIDEDAGKKVAVQVAIIIYRCIFQNIRNRKLNVDNYQNIYREYFERSQS